MSLLKMISLVIFRAACVPRVINLLPSIPNPEALGVSIYETGFQRGSVFPLKSPQSKWLNRLGRIRQITTQTLLQAHFSLDTQIPFCAPQCHTTQRLDSITEISLRQPSAWNCANPDVPVTLFYWVIYIHIIFDISCVVKELGALTYF